MKTELFWKLCFFCTVKVVGFVGAFSKTNTWLHIRWGVFTSQQHQPLPPPYLPGFVVCAGACLADDDCVGVRAGADNVSCRTVNRTSQQEGNIWKLKVVGFVGAFSKTNTWLHIRWGVFTSQQHQPLPPPYLPGFVVCAGACLADDDCVGVRAGADNVSCRTVNRTSQQEGNIWKRNRHHGIQQLTVDNSRSCFVKGYKSTHFLSSRGSRGAWSKDVRHGYGKTKIKLLLLERGNVHTDTRQVRIAAEGDPRQWVTGALIGHGSTGSTVIILSKPPTLCVGNLLYEKEHSCYPIYSSMGLTGGATLYNSSLYVAIGPVIYSMKVAENGTTTRREREGSFKLNYLVVSSVIRPTIAVDAVDGTRILFWTHFKSRQIFRAVLIKNTGKPISPLDLWAGCKRFTITIDRTCHVLYVLTADGELRSLRDIAADHSRWETLAHLSGGWPLVQFQFDSNTVYMIWPNKTSMLLFDVENRRLNEMEILPSQLSVRPRVVTVLV